MAIRVGIGAGETYMRKRRSKKEILIASIGGTAFLVGTEVVIVWIIRALGWG